MISTAKRRLTFIAAGVFLAALAAFVFLHRPSSLFSNDGQRTRVFLIGVDAGSWDTLNRMMAEDKLPHFRKLIDNGAAGYLDSFLWKELIQGIKAYSSPILWASIATGKMPQKHGIEDFTLPLPSEMIAQAAFRARNEYARIKLPDLARGRSELFVRARAAAPREQAKISVYFNNTLLKELHLGKDWAIYDLAIPASAFQIQNQLSVYYPGATEEAGTPIAEFNYFRFYNDYAEEILDLNFIRNKGWFDANWRMPPPSGNALASSFHMRAKTLWDILSEEDRTVAVVGWWQSWPAVPVNGYMVSSHVGFQGVRAEKNDPRWLSKIPQLTYPEDYIKAVEPLMFRPATLNQEIRERFYNIGECPCVGSTQDRIFRNFYWQDRVFEALSIDLLKNKGPFDLFAVYFRGIDASGHQFLRFEKNPDAANDCGECDSSRLLKIVDRYYEYTDEVIGKLMKFADDNTVVMIVTDHGQVATEGKGIHSNNGFIIMSGAPVKAHLMENAGVLDITPTILYLLGLKVAQDMDGNVLMEALKPEYLQKHPLLMTGTYEDPKAAGTKAKEVVDEESTEEGMEQLKALGYVQ